jgi:hypothetical protein
MELNLHLQRKSLSKYIVHSTTHDDISYRIRCFSVYTK